MDRDGQRRWIVFNLNVVPSMTRRSFLQQQCCVVLCQRGGEGGCAGDDDDHVWSGDASSSKENTELGLAASVEVARTSESEGWCHGSVCLTPVAAQFSSLSCASGGSCRCCFGCYVSPTADTVGKPVKLWPLHSEQGDSKEASFL